MKSFDELLENLPQEKELSSEEKERILSLAMQKIRKKPKTAQMKIRYAASMVAVCLVLITVIAVPYATQEKNTMQEAATENVASREQNFLTADTAEEAVQEDQMQAMRTEQHYASDNSIASAQDTDENRDSIAQEEFVAETYDLAPTEETVQMNSALLDDAKPEAAEESDAIFAPIDDMMEDITEEPMPECATTTSGVGGGAGGGSIAAKPQENLIVEAESIEDAAASAGLSEKAEAIAAPKQESIFEAPGCSGSGSSAANVVVITDNESYRSVQRISDGKVTYENTHKRTNRVLTLADFFPTDYDYKNELSLTGGESFYITKENHLMIITASGEIDVGEIVDGKIQK